MPFTPSKLQERTVRADFTFDGEPLWVEYRPAALSDEAQAEMRAISERLQEVGAREVDPDDAEAVAAVKAEADAIGIEFGAWVARLLAGWDYEEDGQPGVMVPLTPERVAAEVARFPDFIASCVAAATTHFQDVKARVGATSGRSDATSSRTAGSTSSPTKLSPKRSA